MAARTHHIYIGDMIRNAIRSYLSRVVHPLFTAGMLLLCLSCEEQAAFSRYQSLPIQGWLASDTIRVDVDTIRQDAQYQVNLGIRTSSARSYPYQTLTLVVEQQWIADSLLPGMSDFYSRDTLQVAMASPSGDILGKGISSFQYTIPFPSRHLYPGIKGTFRIYHLMRTRRLSGITNVGIELIPQ